MKLVNTDGMAFIGPGSEWFWTALSGLVLAITFIAIYRQLSLARSAGAIAQMDAFDRDWSSERFARNKLEVLLAQGDSSDWAAVPDGAAAQVANFWEKLGTLAKDGHIDAGLLWDSYGNDVELWWITLRSWIGAKRSEMADRTIYVQFEWLARRMTDLDRQSQVPVLSQDLVRSSVARRIVALENTIRIEQALRTVLIASPEPVTSAPVATAAADA
jgi:hypothetical protein